MVHVPPPETYFNCFRRSALWGLGVNHTPSTDQLFLLHVPVQLSDSSSSLKLGLDSKLRSQTILSSSFASPAQESWQPTLGKGSTCHLLSCVLKGHPRILCHCGLRYANRQGSGVWDHKNCFWLRIKCNPCSLSSSGVWKKKKICSNSSPAIWCSREWQVLSPSFPVSLPSWYHPPPRPPATVRRAPVQGVEESTDWLTLLTSELGRSWGSLGRVGSSFES